MAIRKKNVSESSRSSLYEVSSDGLKEPVDYSMVDERINSAVSKKKNILDDLSYSLMRFVAVNDREFQAYFGSKEAVECFFERFERLFPSDSVNCLKDRIDLVSYNQDSPEDVKKWFRGYVSEVFPELDPELGERMLLWFNNNICRISGDDYCYYTGCKVSPEGCVVPEFSFNMGRFMLNKRLVLVQETDSVYDNRVILDGKTLFSHGPYVGVKKLCLDYPDGQVDYEVLVIPSGHGRCRPGIGSDSDFKTFDIYADNGVRLFKGVTFEVMEGIIGLDSPYLNVTANGSTTAYMGETLRNMAYEKEDKHLNYLSSIGVGESFKAVMANERAKNLKPALTPAGLFIHVTPQDLEKNTLPYDTSVYIDKNGKKILLVNNFEKHEVPEDGLYLIKKNVTTSFYDVYSKECFESTFKLSGHLAMRKSSEALSGKLVHKKGRGF